MHPRDEVDELRRRLDAAYCGPTFDVEEAGRITARLRALVNVMNDISDKKLAELRELYDNGIGANAAARRLWIDRTKVLQYFHKFRLDGGRPPPTIPTFGDPSPERSALAKKDAWKPPTKVYPAYAPHTSLVEKSFNLNPLPRVTKVDAEVVMPTADQVALAIVMAARVTGGDPVLALTASSLRGKQYWLTSRARQYAGNALCQAFPQMARPDIAKLIGVGLGSRHVYFASFEFRLRNRDAPWFDQSVVDSIAASLQ